MAISMKKFMYSALALTLALATAFAIMIPASAYDGEEDKNNYIYVDSLDEVDWENLSAYDVIVIPNENLPQDEVEDAEPLVARDTSAVAPCENSAPSGTWNIATKGQYNFDGYTYASSYLYTNWNFTGKSSYKIQITNRLTSSDTITRFMGSWEVRTYRKVTVPAGTTAIFTLNTNSASHEVTESTKWMIRFNNPVNTYGFVK